ncbi:C40 family peptidase [Flavobacterium johnsoniae]|uniref:NlpC/P60 family protein n=2 Tax=Flavobacterium johnsoniae TaxID=986 RepID=A0A1M5GQA4_FLAJO|nr:C40 family peptidase [Flavobacterium johnsoniae]ABQ04458.1 NLP/P60 protein; peptidase family C40 [Flavobacterium johnsoniae UW101]OXE97784.1 glycoside hydrolase [Flavobacterium johnsoniae UW101]WQG83746.1 C40 family peptidase [Flavobacterium johnsoniae UW101]SHG05837.1 NlpC/P60 family protein [Flavobacterium johnsoniae]SHK22956.1 NlpC/P60 family protein [Flavobacterium johnsoniae]
MKKIFVFLLLSIVFVSCKSTSTVAGKSTSKNESKKENRSLVKNLIDTATDNIGVKYKAGGTTKSGFDCSGLVYTTFESENIKLPRSSFEQAKIGKVIPLNDAKKGDLIFFKTNKSRQINHVGLITEVNSDEIKFVHSSTSKGVIISSTKEPYYKNSFEQVNRVLE